MTAQEVINQAKTEFDETEGGFTDAQWLLLLNEGYTDFNRYTEMREKLSTQVVTAYESLYSLPSDFLESRQIRWSYNRQLFPRHEKKLDYDAKEWVFQVGTPDQLAYFNYNSIRLVPIPSAAGTITFRHSYLPADLTLTDELEIPGVFQDSLKDWLVATGQIIFRQVDAGFERFMVYMQKRLKARAQARQYQRTPDTFFAQRPVTVFNFPLWDSRYRAYQK